MEQRQTKKSFKAINSTIQEFASITTIHGLAYVFDRSGKTFDNVLWFISVFIGTVFSIYMSHDAWKTWQDSPVLTSIKSTGLPLQKIDFPAITICSQGLIQVHNFL